MESWLCESREMSNDDLGPHRTLNPNENKEGSDIEEVSTDLSEDEEKNDENSNSDSTESSHVSPKCSSHDDTDWSTDMVDSLPDDFVKAISGLPDLLADAIPIDFFYLCIPETFFIHETNMYA